MIDKAYILSQVKGSVDLTTTGVRFGAKDWPHAVIAIIAAVANFIPEVGPLIGSITSLLGAILIPSPAALDPWDEIKARVEALVNVKISKYNTEVLRATVRGLQDNMTHFSRLMKAYHKAATDEKAKLAESLRIAYGSFLSVVRVNIPKFQLGEYRVQTLAMFGYAATLHLTLLAEGIENGVKWGLADTYVNEILVSEFDEHVGFRANTLTLPYKMELDMLQDSIKQGEALNWSPTLLNTWREAHSILAFKNQTIQEHSLDTRSPDDINPADYPAYVKKVYLEGRKMIQPPPSPRNNWDYGRGFKEAWKRRALADFDTFFMTGVLSFAELWPYMIKGRKIPPEVENILDRELFAGPYGRYTENVPFDESTPPPVKPRIDNITEFKFRTGDDVVGFQAKYGDKWGTYWGSKTDGREFTVDMKKGEHMEKVGVWWGAKIGQLNFSSQPIGPHRHADVSEIVSIPGYALSSVKITHVESHAPPGCEGVLFGFRSLMFK